MRSDGFVPIADYAAIGDGRTVALVARDGSVDWLAVPTLDGATVFGALLDAEGGGSFALTPVGDFDATRRYLPRSNVVETTFTTAEGEVKVTDGLLLQDGGELSWIELARRIRGVRGRVRLRYVLRPRFDFGRAETHVERGRNDAFLARAGRAVLAFRAWEAGDAAIEGDAIVGELEVRRGTKALLACQIVDDEPVPLPPRDEIELRFDRTVEAWARWSSFHENDHPWNDEVTRSALALKLLVVAHTGAIAAAATTSIPERIGGDLNWDYRFAWVRDSALTMDSLGDLGYREQVHASLSWLLGATADTHPELKPFYGLDGSDPHEAKELPLPGYRGSRPVRSGNDAASQRQLGSYGDLIETIGLYVEHGNTLDADTARRVREVADRVCEEWRKKDSGIWELPDERHYTHSKVQCWVALDRALRLDELGEVEGGDVERWSAERTAIRAWVDEHCWSERRRAYTFYSGCDDLDASVLLAARVGFIRGDDPRLSTTIDAIRDELGAGGPLLYRYSGQQEVEGAFLACSFWLVVALARCGRIDEARQTMDELVALANDVGLYAEQIDPASGELLGNFPQGLTHLSLIIAATAIAAAEGERG